LAVAAVGAAGWEINLAAERTNFTMIKNLFISRLLLAFVLCAFFAAEIQAQQRQTGNRGTGGGGGGGGRATGNRGTGGGGRTSASGSAYAPPGEIGEAIVTADPETRRLIVITDEETEPYLRQVITNLDRPKPQVLIKVVFLEVTYRNGSDIGFEGAYRKGFGNSSTGVLGQVFGLGGLNSSPTNLTYNQFGQPTSAFAPTPPGAGLYQVLGQDFTATLRAIAQAGKTEILSRPSILTRNSQQATISLGQEVPLITNTRFDTLGNQINTVTYTSVGIILKVTPFITSDGLVEMIVTPESSSLADRSQWVPISGGALAPVINSRIADTVVVVPNGQTVIIGGLMENSKLKAESKIPYISSIPLLGNLFKHTIKDNSKTELMIFLTPHIVSEPQQLASLTASENNKVQIAPQAFTEEEMNLYLDNLPNKIGPTNQMEQVNPPKKSKSKK
jgi:general secretion pathway protein D